MKGRPLPHVLIMALVAVAVAQPAAALPPSSVPAAVEPVRVELVDEATLGAVTGKYFGADMLVGVRIDVLSTVTTPQGTQASAAGALYIRRDGDGFQVHVDTHAAATDAGTAVVATGTPSASGGAQVQVAGIGQVAQIAGDGNRLGNLAVVRVADALTAPTGFNGQASADAHAGAAVARISFTDGQLALGVSAPGISLAQASTPGAGFVQTGQIAGNGLTGMNTLQMQVVTAAMPTLSLQQLGIQQALGAVTGLRR